MPTDQQAMLESILDLRPREYKALSSQRLSQVLWTVTTHERYLAGAWEQLIMNLEGLDTAYALDYDVLHAIMFPYHRDTEHALLAYHILSKTKHKFFLLPGAAYELYNRLGEMAWDLRGLASDPAFARMSAGPLGAVIDYFSSSALSREGDVLPTFRLDARRSARRSVSLAAQYRTGLRRIVKLLQSDNFVRYSEVAPPDEHSAAPLSSVFRDIFAQLRRRRGQPDKERANIVDADNLTRLAAQRVEARARYGSGRRPVYIARLLTTTQMLTELDLALWEGNSFLEDDAERERFPLPISTHEAFYTAVISSMYDGDSELSALWTNEARRQCGEVATWCREQKLKDHVLAQMDSTAFKFDDLLYPDEARDSRLEGWLEALGDFMYQPILQQIARGIIDDQANEQNRGQLRIADEADQMLIDIADAIGTVKMILDKKQSYATEHASAVPSELPVAVPLSLEDLEIEEVTERLDKLTCERFSLSRTTSDQEGRISTREVFLRIDRFPDFYSVYWTTQTSYAEFLSFVSALIDPVAETPSDDDTPVLVRGIVVMDTEGVSTELPLGPDWRALVLGICGSSRVMTLRINTPHGDYYFENHPLALDARRHIGLTSHLNLWTRAVALYRDTGSVFVIPSMLAGVMQRELHEYPALAEQEA